MSYKTILSEKKSTYGSPYCFYTVQYEETSRSSSKVTLSIRIKAHLQYAESYSGWPMTAVLTVGGTNFSIPLKGTETWSGTATHTITKSITVSASASSTSLSAYLTVNNSNTTASELSKTACSNITISKYYTAASISCSGGKIGDSISYKLSGKYPSSAKCTITCKFGDYSCTVANSDLDNGTHSWNTEEVKQSLLQEMTTSTSKSCTLTCVTKYGDTTVGTKSCTFNLTTDESVKITDGSYHVAPVNDAIPEESRALFDGLFIAGISKVSAQIEAIPGDEAQITDTVFTLIDSEDNSIPLTADTTVAANTKAVKVTVSDSRKTSASQTEEITVLDYQLPHASIYVERGTFTTDNGTQVWQPAPSGPNLKITTDFNISPLNQINKPDFEFFIGDTALSAESLVKASETVDGVSPYLCYYISELSSEVTHTIKAKITDTVGNSKDSAPFELPSEKVNMSFKSNNGGVTFGGHPEENGLVCHFPATFYNSITLDLRENGFTEAFYADKDAEMATLSRLLLDYVHPIGSYYWSSDPTDPGLLFGGVWKPIKDKFVLAAGDKYTAIDSEGGSETVTLTTSNLPAHTHGSKSLTGYFRIRSCNTGGTDYSVVSSSGIISRSKSVWEGTHERFSTASNTDPNYEKVTVDATHTHTTVGEGVAHDNMPPYIIAYCWVRIDPEENIIDQPE